MSLSQSSLPPCPSFRCSLVSIPGLVGVCRSDGFGLEQRLMGEYPCESLNDDAYDEGEPGPSTLVKKVFSSSTGSMLRATSPNGVSSSRYRVSHVNAISVSMASLFIGDAGGGSQGTFSKVEDILEMPVGTVAVVGSVMLLE
jgi:hypothetical protein